MNKTLLTYLSVFMSVLLFANLASGQVDKGKSRLDIGKKPTTNKTAALPKYTLSPAPTEVRLNKPSVINQYYRNSLLNSSSKAVPAKASSLESVSAERSVASAPENVGTDKMFINEKISVSNIYPNPANEYAFIDYAVLGNVNSAKITFYNIIGNEVDEYELDKDDKKLRVRTATWDSGMYMYQLVVDGKKIATKKLIVKHN